MSTFDIRQDAPGLLRSEAVNITLKFDRTGPTSGRISWNIPIPAAGCTADTQAYCGMLIAIDTTPASIQKIPKNGQVYSSDATADSNLFAGDIIGSARIIGAFYNDRTTTFVDVTGLLPNTPYYVSGYPVDCQYRYFIEGVHAYSQDYKNRGTDGTHGTQVVVFNPYANPMGAKTTDWTGLHPNQTYEFSIQIGLTPSPLRPLDSVECRLAAPSYTITIDGNYAQTFEELANEINRQFAMMDSCAQGPTAPNTGAFYWKVSTKQLFQWNGSTHVELPVIVQATAPNTVSIGTYWLDTTTNILAQWSGTIWAETTTISFDTDPTKPIADTTLWLDSTGGIHLWNGVTWCNVGSYTQTTDPSLAVTPPGGSFWYNTDSGLMYRWNTALHIWVATDVIQYLEDPNTLSDGTYWFNEQDNTLNIFNVPDVGWNQASNYSVTENEPQTPAAGKLWYNPSTFELFQRSLDNTEWTALDVLSFPFDPTVRSSCDLWWNTDTDTLYVWNNTTSAWVAVANFYQQSTDPSLPIAIEEGSVWYDPSTGQMHVWENNCFKTVSYLSGVDPTTTVPGTIWHDTTNDNWYVWNGSSWDLINYVKSAVDPNTLPTGTYWFDTSVSGLKLWNGVTWVALTYSTQQLAPVKGACWFDTITNVLKQWDGYAYVPSALLATAEIDCNGNLLFTDATVGSTSYVKLTDGTLFKSIGIPTVIHDENPGTDGASDQPTYTEFGIGTDGSDAVRAALINDIRYDLGYPVVDVELTKEQMDHAVSRAIMELRGRSSIAYKRGFFFMGIKPNEQKFYLTNKTQGMHKIVDVLGVYRLTSSFLSSAHGAGVYGQIVLQHMYNMGTFDLLSYHLMSEYSKLMEMLFAGRITYNWNEQTRELFMHHKFNQAEPMVCIEATSERTEQDIITDRYSRPWIRRYSTAVCRMMLAEIRGKYAALPGAGGSITLNAQDLRAQAKEEFDQCAEEIDSFVVDKPDEYGMGSTMIFG